MNKITINGITAINFGSNNYSCGMEAIVFDHTKNTVKEVQSLPNVFLHPTCSPNSLEIFALLGNTEQFELFYERCVESEITKEVVSNHGLPKYSDIMEWDIMRGRIDDKISDFVPWYKYYQEPITGNHD